MMLRDKVVVVTAAAGTGIGSAAARRCLEEGACVVISDRHASRLASSLACLEASFGPRVHAVECDVTSTAQVDALVAAVCVHLQR